MRGVARWKTVRHERGVFARTSTKKHGRRKKKKIKRDERKVTLVANGWDFEREAARPHDRTGLTFPGLFTVRGRALAGHVEAALMIALASQF